ncbi:MAG: hypothetical protein ACK54F_09690 [Planctomycetia bacterium]|jgi:hypothetical protein
MAVHVWADRVVACDNTVLHPKESPEAAQLKAQGGFNRRFIGDAKVAPVQLDPAVWHEFVLEARGRQQRVLIDGREVLTYDSLAGDVPKTEVQLSLGSPEQPAVYALFDDATVGPLAAGK